MSEPDSPAHRRKVSILYFEGCPNHPPTADRVRAVIAELDLDADVEEVELTSSDEVDRLRFLGSPTVQVDGVDIEPAARGRTDFAMSCRIYTTPDGLPSQEMLLAALDPTGHGAAVEQPMRSAGIAGLHCCEADEARRPQGALRPSSAISGSLVTAGGSLVAAMLSSACCWVPILLVAFGASAAGVSAFFGPWRPFFIVAAVAMLALSFYLTFIRRPVAPCCSTGETPRRRLGRATWWVSAAIVAAFVFFPQYVGRALGGSSRHAAAGASAWQAVPREFAFRVDGMHCEACATSLTATLSKLDGVMRVNVDYASKTGHVSVAGEEVISSVVDAIRSAGFSVSQVVENKTP